MPKSDLERAIAQYRADLLANESQATMAIANAYKASRERLIKRIEALTESIAEDGAEFTASEVLKWQRAKTLLRQVEAEMGSLATASAQPITDAQAAAVDLASEQSKGLAMATAQSAGADAIVATIDTTWNRLNTGAAEAIVGRMSDGSPLADWLEQFGKKASGIIAESLQSAAALGTNPRAVARELAKQLDISAARLLLMSRTEILGAQRTATMQNYQNNADIVDGWIWISAHQTRTCLACLALDGQFFPLTVDFQAAHVSCRCSSRASVKGVDMTKRGIRTGAQWFDAQPDAVRREMIPKGLWDDYQSGNVTLQDFRQLHEDDRWGPSYREATIPQARANAKRRERIGSVPTPIKATRSTVPVFKSTDDAATWASENLKTEIRGVKGTDTNLMSEVFRVVKLAEDRTGAAMPASVEFGGIKGKAYGQYNWKTNTVHLRKRYQNLTESMNADNVEWMKRTKGDIPFHSTESIEGLVWHEFAHAYDQNAGFRFRRALNNLSLEEKRELLKVSGYSGEDFSASRDLTPTKGESWAESFAAVVTNSPRAEFVPESVKKLIRTVLNDTDSDSTVRNVS